MKGRDFERFAKVALSALPEPFQAQGTLIVASPVHGLLRAFQWNASAYSKTDGYLYAFVQPMYVPVSYFFYTHGDRVWPNSAHRWEIDSAHGSAFTAQLGQALDNGFENYLKPIPDVHAFAQHLKARVSDECTDVNQLEELAYSLAAIGRLHDASKVLDRLIQESPKIAAQVAWVQQVVTRSNEMRTLIASNPDGAMKRLHQYRRGTLAALKLEKWAVSDDLT